MMNEGDSRRLRSKRAKVQNMNTDKTVDDKETEWNLFFQNIVQAEPKLDSKENDPFYSYSENGVDFEVTVQERKRYTSLLTELPKIQAKLKCWPNVKQKILALSIAAYVSQDEKSFQDLNARHTYEYLMEMVKSSTNCVIKMRYIDMLSSCFDHDSGTKWSLESNYWLDMYNLALDCQKNNCPTEKVYNTLSKFLQKLFRRAPKACTHVIKQMTQPLIVAGYKNYPKVKKQPVEALSASDCADLTPVAVCLVETLERLLAHPVTDILRIFAKTQVREVSDTLADLSEDDRFSLLLNRILIILSFYEMTEFFDGIRVINHDPIALSGFLRIVERELKKRHMKIIFELYYYAQRYWKCVCRKMPQYFLKGKPVDVEDELMSFQVEPVVIIAEKLLGVPQTSEEELRKCYLADLLNLYSADSLQLGYEIREQLVKEPLDIEITALECIVKSKPMYSRKNTAIVFQALIYSLRDFIKYIKKDAKNSGSRYDQLLAKALLEAILVYLENFDLSWRESIGSIELTNLVYEFLLFSTDWSSEVVLRALKTLNITISKHMSPNMALLVDNAQNCIYELGSILFAKCFNNDWEVRNATLTVLYTICQEVNKGFHSFKKILEDSLPQDLIVTMAITDCDETVRATALKCVQQLILIEDFGKNLYHNCGFIDKIINLISTEADPLVKKEAIILMSEVYKSDQTAEAACVKIEKIMTKVALSTTEPDVQEEAVQFWRQVIKKHLEKQGMVDETFPATIFSKAHKKIIRMDDREIRKRLIQTLDEMSKCGCFAVLQGIIQNDSTPRQVFATAVEIVTKLLKLLQEYEVTPEFILLNQTYPNIWSVSSNILQSPSTMEDDDMQIIMEETIMEMINDSETTQNRTSSSGPLTSIEAGELGSERSLSENASNQISIVDFMDFIYRKLSFLNNY